MAAGGGGGSKIRNAKLVLLGDVGTGKSSLVLRFVKGQFVEFQESTISAAFFSQTLAVNDETVKFEIWDTAGQERYHSLTPMYYRGAAAAVVVYDITNAASFTRAKKWVQELQAQGNPNTVMALAGNKADMLEARQVPAEEAKTYAQENGLFFMETSAKTAANVNDVFYEIAKRLLQGQQAQNPQAGMVLSQRPTERMVRSSSSAAVALSAVNKTNSAKKKYHHTLGTCGYKTAVPKWEAFEVGLLAKGIIPQTADWPERSKFWLFVHGAGLDPQTGQIVAKGKWKKKIEKISKELEDAIEKVRKGEYQPDRENDELTLALGNPEHIGRRLRCYGAGVSWKKGFAEYVDKSRQRKKKELDRLSELERKVQRQQEQLDSIIQQRASQQQLEGPEIDAVPSDQRKSSVGSTQLEDSVFESPAAHYPVDDVTEKTSCELHMPMKNISLKVAVGYALPNQPRASYHHGQIPAGYAHVGVEEIMPGFDTLELDIAGADDEKTLREVKRGFILWNKKYIVFPVSVPRPPTPPCRNPPQSPSLPDREPASTSPLPALSRQPTAPTTKSIKRKLIADR